MNERIKELVRQAREQTEEFNSVRNKLTTEEWAEIYNEKFAELIVKKCIKMVENEAAQYAEPVWAFELVNDMHEHFGVTE